MFVADEIPRELARIVEFLNDQMRADVRAVELRWFADEHGGISLSPRIIGETERAAVAKGTRQAKALLTRDEWLNRHIAPTGTAAMAGARAYIQMVEKLGGEATMASAQGSIYAAFQDAEGKTLYPLHLWGNNATVSLSYRWLKAARPLSDEAVRQQWFERLQAIVGPLSGNNLAGFPSFKVDLLADPSIRKGVDEFLADLVHLLQSRLLA